MKSLVRLLRAIGRRSRPADRPSASDSPAGERPEATHPTHPDGGETAPPADVVELEIGPEIDLHSFSPRETRDVVDAYLQEAHDRGLQEVRIVHGRGKGVQRNIVRSLLSRHPLVESFRDAHPGSGGWGATIVILRVHERDERRP